MKLKKTVPGIFLLILFYFFFSISPRAAFADGKPSDSSFSKEFNEAIVASEKGDIRKSYDLFDELLRKHPDEILVYDAYADISASQGNYRRALQISKKWVALHGADNASSLSVNEKIAFVENQIKLEGEMKKAPLWKEAKVSGNQIFTFVTNVPEPYASEKAQEILELMEKSKQIVADIFGHSAPDRPLKIYLAARNEEYWKLTKEKTHSLGISSAAYYISKKQEIVISTVAMNRAAVAHELTHHFIYEHIPHPSTFISEGIAGYVEMKLGKKFSAIQLRDYLETLNYLYDQGEWENFLDVTRAWKAFLAGRGIIQKRLGVLRDNIYTLFYMSAWATTHFFVETKDPFFQQLFRDYLSYEKSQKTNTVRTFTKYFSEHLTKDQMNALNDQWGRHTVNLTYESI